MVEVLDAWPLTVADVLGESGPVASLRWSPGDGLASALGRLLRPDRQLMLLAIDALDVPEQVRRTADPARQPPGSANAA